MRNVAGVNFRLFVRNAYCCKPFDYLHRLFEGLMPVMAFLSQPESHIESHRVEFKSAFLKIFVGILGEIARIHRVQIGFSVLFYHVNKALLALHMNTL